ncbi:hypothetical protein EIP91_010018 [Steccherinum ochraceum]|uniref:Uncharacterized protein n=1 Tax=Steccherinum ochraceum TaxID=92696 RepID=A0A4R0R399_9APHY|nr:hypothetical protein EIP91_010018 [Steccherinum ochraceum]
MGHWLDQYRVERASVDVEFLAAGIARYLQVIAEDAEALSQDPHRRDKLFAEIRSQPGVRTSPYASQSVKPGEDPDLYLVPANAAIDSLTPPSSFEDRVKRMHIAFPAMMVYNEYKLKFALVDHPDLRHKVDIRRQQIMDEWRRDVLGVPSTTCSWHAQKPNTRPPTPTLALNCPDSRHSSKRLSEDESEDFLKNPQTMIGKQFFYESPSEGSKDSGVWVLLSYQVRMAEDRSVVYEYKLFHQAYGTRAITFGREDVANLLKYSSMHC